MADTTDTTNVNVNVSTQTYSGESTSDTDTMYIGDNTYEGYNVSQPILRKDSDLKTYIGSSTDGMTGYRYNSIERTKAVPIEDGQGYRVSNPLTGAYDEEVQYRTAGALRYHWERVTPQGSFFLREVDVFDNGTKSVHREYSNPTTGKNYLHEYQC